MRCLVSIARPAGLLARVANCFSRVLSASLMGASGRCFSLVRERESETLRRDYLAVRDYAFISDADNRFGGKNDPRSRFMDLDGGRNLRNFRDRAQSYGSCTARQA